MNKTDHTPKKPQDLIKPYGDTYSLRDLLTLHTYDFVTIQQVSSQSFKAKSYEPHAQIHIEFIHRYAPKAEILVHQTWAYSPEAKRLKDWDLARQTMHDSLVHNYDRLAKRYDLHILPSGAALQLCQLYRREFSSPPLKYIKPGGYNRYCCDGHFIKTGSNSSVFVLLT